MSKKCGICKEFLSEVRTVLSCCKSLVCARHVDEEFDFSSSGAQKRKLFTCSICDYAHNMERKRFAINTVINQIGHSHIQAEAKCQQLKISLEKMKNLNSDPKKCIKDHIDGLKNIVRVRKEELIAEIESMYSQTIQETDDYEAECYKSLNEKNIQQRFREIEKKNEEISMNIREWSAELKKFPIDEENLESIYSEAFFLNKQLISAQTDLKDDLILNKVFAFQESITLTNEFELISFPKSNSVSNLEKSESIVLPKSEPTERTILADNNVSSPIKENIQNSNEIIINDKKSEIKRRKKDSFREDKSIEALKTFFKPILELVRGLLSIKYEHIKTLIMDLLNNKMTPEDFLLEMKNLKILIRTKESAKSQDSLILLKSILNEWRSLNKPNISIACLED